VAVADGSSASEAAASSGFDALVLDLGWPELELRRLREALAPGTDAEPDSLIAAERRHIALTLRYTGGNRRRAAQLLGVSRSTLLHKIRKYGLDET
jgi:transcriptional regulator of acetoin/glycerol metabolism